MLAQIVAAATELECCPTLPTNTFPQWRMQVAESFVPMEVYPATSGDAGFRADMTRTQLGMLSVSVVRADAHRAVRSAGTIAKHPASYVKMSRQLNGRLRVTQGGRTALLQPGDFVLYDTSKPYEIAFLDHAHCLVIQVPHDDLGLPASQVTDLCAKPLAAEDFLPGLPGLLDAQAFDHRAHDHAPNRLGELLAQLIAMDLHRMLGTTAPEPSGIGVHAIERYLAAHLSSPDLSPGRVAQALFISPRQLQRIFHARETTFALWVRNQRLDRAHRMLLTSDRPIATISAECGFGSASDFSRSFRRRFGVTAREARHPEG